MTTPPRPLRKLLVANRGEIACRVMRTAHRLGLRTVAVYSDADVQAPHVRLADEAVRIGPAPAALSYLDIPALLDAARRTGADAVHPGYGFLSERADFAQACLDAGLVFVGPPPAAIRAMGDKAGAKRRMLDAGVPCAPGYLGAEQSDDRLAAEAVALGFPLLVKAVAGGGGRGMRLVRAANELPDALAGARREAQSAFGDGTLMLERLIDDGRHIEIQVFADTHGHVIHLGERDCTAQRRRQKVIEEAPSPIVDAAMREAMGRDAVAAARAVGYVGAGTVEFIVDAQRRHFFLEMNTRLQVEHPVTEAVTGFDLVEWQLRVAEGAPLPVTQAEVPLNGHAIEVRLYAEDPYDGFRPQTGPVRRWRPDAAGVRVDHGLAEGGEIGPHYDAMVAKLIAHGADRADAIRRLTRALEDTPLIGPRHNARFLRDLLAHPDFTSASMTTTRLDEWAAAGAPIVQRPVLPGHGWALAAALLSGDAAAALRPAGLVPPPSTLRCDGQTRRVGHDAAARGGLQLLGWDGEHARYAVDGVLRQAVAVRHGDGLSLVLDGAVFEVEAVSPWPSADRAADARQVRANVAGVVAQVRVQPGDVVAAGQPLVCVEAMKMELWFNAGAAGTVVAVHVQAQASVAAGAVLVELALHEDTPA